MQHLDFVKIEENPTATPSSVTMLVSLFLILITFFIVITHSLPANVAKKSIAFESLEAKFGKPAEEAINFGGLLQPKPETFILQIEKLLGTTATINSTSNGDEVAIESTKDVFYYSDEPTFRPDKLETIIKLQKILLEWDKSSDLRITFILGLQDFAREKNRLENFRKIMPLKNVNTGIDPGSANRFSIVIKYE